MEHPKTCPHCGVAVVGMMKFCTSCGKNVLNTAARDPLRAPRTFSPVAIVITVLVVLIIVGLVAVANEPQSSTSASPARMVTINGRDEQGALIDPVNVWKDYTNRGLGVAGQTHDGARVTFIQQQGSGTQIELPNGVRGWVNSAFIK